ncbi:MAG: cupredoxin domain-containing protein [Actinomycetota bacterium]
MLTLVAGSTFFAAGPARPAGADVVIRAKSGDRWAPQHSFVRRGKDGKAAIKWKNPTGTKHDIKSTNEGKDWFLKRTILRKGDAKTKTFKSNGKYHYRCTIHSVKDNGVFIGMVGIVHVRK